MHVTERFKQTSRNPAATSEPSQSAHFAKQLASWLARLLASHRPLLASTIRKERLGVDQEYVASDRDTILITPSPRRVGGVGFIPTTPS